MGTKSSGLRPGWDPRFAGVGAASRGSSEPSVDSAGGNEAGELGNGWGNAQDLDA